MFSCTGYIQSTAVIILFVPITVCSATLTSSLFNAVPSTFDQLRTLHLLISECYLKLFSVAPEDLLQGSVLREEEPVLFTKHQHVKSLPHFEEKR